ncbi:thioredoxin family protein [Paenibacillus sp. Marseille-P2973]|uniref:thioredoxin family protein n=1 Tax=Paenibacillus sp. Marseille-P2973 TaxID=1871032 RepID=UPI001B36026E|nr:thioredoxin family protein [Paenibacillus sp. Marseille-P2973]MBQ4901983.1 thioredoxin family protein [Paenibacillus sp. Marseille-P2973]
MSVNVAYKFGKGITPRQFMEGMERNKEAFSQGYENFAWVSEEDREFFESLNFRDDIRVLILAADWCGDVVRSVPVVFRALEVSGLKTEVLILEDHQDLMDHFLTMGGRSVPIIIFADTGGHVLGQWGPRPAHVQALMVEFKQDNPDREASDYEEKIGIVRKRMAEKYEEGAGVKKSVVTELRTLISGM